jgi:hypothetical protein
MALAQAWNTNPNDDFFIDDIKLYDYPIQGKMVVAKCHISELTLITDDIKEYVRNKLIHQIADCILQNKLVEFTQIKDPISSDTLVRARCFITPDEQVKIIRSLHKVE